MGGGRGGGGTHYMKVTTYAPPFGPPFFKSLVNLYSFDPYILAKMRKMYFDPYFSSKLGKMYSFDPLLFFYPCSFSSRWVALGIPIRNLTEWKGHSAGKPLPQLAIREDATFLLKIIQKKVIYSCDQAAL